MKCRGMRLPMFMLVFLVSYSAAVTVHEIDEPDSLRLELDPHDYVPLAVGNRWTYEHHYANDSYPGTESEYLKASTSAHKRGDRIGASLHRPCSSETVGRLVV